MILGTTFLRLFSASDLPLCACHSSMLSTDFKVSHRAAACHTAARQTRQCDAGSPATCSRLYLSDPVFIFQITLTDNKEPDRLKCFSNAQIQYLSWLPVANRFKAIPDCF